MESRVTRFKWPTLATYLGVAALAAIFFCGCGEGAEEAAETDAGAEGDAAMSDPRATANTTMVLYGDSIVSDLWQNWGRVMLVKSGNKAVNYSVAGTFIETQYGVWLTSKERGAQLDFIFIQVGVNNILRGDKANAMEASMKTWLADIQAMNPQTIVILSLMTPAKGDFDNVPGPARYPVWLDLNDRYRKLGGDDTISNALNNGSDYLKPEYANADGLHPNPAGDTLSANLLYGIRDRLWQASRAKFTWKAPTL